MSTSHEIGGIAQAHVWIPYPFITASPFVIELLLPLLKTPDDKKQKMEKMMRPISRRLLASALHVSETPLSVIARAPIGYVKSGELAARRTLQTCAAPRGWSVQRQVTSRRWQSTWEKQPVPGSQPKRSNTAPLLAGVLGASALAYLGSKFTLQDDEDHENPVKTNDNIDLEDGEGKHLLHIP